jgi:hypothetical protein
MSATDGTIHGLDELASDAILRDFEGDLYAITDVDGMEVTVQPAVKRGDGYTVRFWDGEKTINWPAEGGKFRISDRRDMSVSRMPADVEGDKA